MRPKRIRVNEASIKWCFPVLLAILCCQPTSAQEKKAQLPYVHPDADVIIVSRPARILGKDDFQKLDEDTLKGLKKVVSNITNSYFKLTLVEIEDIDQITYATEIPSMESMQQGKSPYSAVVIKTKRDNAQGFDMLTQQVKETYDIDSKEFFELEKPVNMMYRFAYIADEKTIAWSFDKDSIENTLKAGKKGAPSAEWLELWKPFAEKDISMAMAVKNTESFSLPPNMKALEKAKLIALGADIGQSTNVKVVAKFASREDAKEAVEAIKEGIKMGKEALGLNRGRLKPSGQGLQTKLLGDLLKATKVKSSGNTVQVTAAIKIKFKELFPMFGAAQKAARRTQAANNVRQCVLAFHNYESAYGKFVRPVMVSDSGKKYSWRIAILPFIEQNELYEQYDFDQDWDSPHNRRVTAKMPDVFKSDLDDDSPYTSWFMLTGNEGIFGKEDSGFGDIADGSSNTILAVEAKRKIHWAKPEDIFVDPEKPFPKLGGFHDGGFNVALADGSVTFMPEDIDEETLWQMFTRSGGEVIDYNRPEFKDR